MLRVTGTKIHVEALAAAAGTLVQSSSVTDLLTISAGLVFGGLLGSLAVHLGAIRLSIGTVGGLLIVAIVMSWMRTRYPQLGGPIPEPARRLLEDLGLSIFIASVGLSAGPGLIQALSSGKVIPLIVTTFVLGFIPAVVAWWVGISALHLNPALLRWGRDRGKAELSRTQDCSGYRRQFYTRDRLSRSVYDCDFGFYLFRLFNDGVLANQIIEASA